MKHLHSYHWCSDGIWNVFWNLECKVFVGTDVTGETSLGDCAVRVGCIVRVDALLVWAVVLLVGLAVVAFETGENLCSNTYTVADLDGLDRVADFDGTTDDLVPDNTSILGVCERAPASTDGVLVARADWMRLSADCDKESR